MADITIIIPVYNAEEYLRECLDSAVNQTVKDIKIIIVDDGATDSSPKICDEYAERDERITVIHKENGGVCDARNVGTAAVTTRWFTFLESDDWLPADACEKLCSKATEHGADFVVGTYYKVDTSGTTVKHPFPYSERVYCTEEERAQFSSCILGLTGDRLRHPENIDSLLTDTAKLFDTALVRDNGLVWVSRKEIYSDCLDFLLKYSLLATRVVYFDEPLYYYRRTNVGSQTAGYRKNTIGLWRIQFNALREIIEKSKITNLWGAYYSRVCFSIIPIGGNAYRTGNKKDGMKEVKEALSLPIYKEAFRNFRIGALPLKYRPLFFFAKHRWCGLFYKMTVIMRKKMNKQRGL